MSHIVSITTQVRDSAAAVAACQRLGLPPPVHRQVQLFQRRAEGLAIELPDWHYRSSATSPRAASSSDNFNGAWAPKKNSTSFCRPVLRVAKIEARKKGYTVAEQPLANGCIRADDPIPPPQLLVRPSYRRCRMTPPIIRSSYASGRDTHSDEGLCRQLLPPASLFLEQALGVQATEQLTAEFYQQAAAQQRLHSKCPVTTLRRRVLRPATSAPVADPRQIALWHRHAQFIQGRSALRRWLTRLNGPPRLVDLHSESRVAD